MIKSILSIDLDSIWEGEETAYVNPDKLVNTKMLDLVKSLSQKSRSNIKLGIDHHELCSIIDECDYSFEIDNIDAHHDLYAEDYDSWLNPLFIRSSKITVGNFLFQLLRENRLSRVNWLTPSYYNKQLSQKKILENIGKFYFKKVSLINACEYSYKEHYDLIFISISPEWIPSKNRTVIKEILTDFGFSKNMILSYLDKVDLRWSFQDNEELILADRFYFKEMYCRR